MFKITDSIKARFLEKVKKCPETGCWNWTGAIDTPGYGAFKIGDKKYNSHRISYILFKNDFDKTKLVCHSCDNKKCVNPEHLFLGTHRDNLMDSINKNNRKSQKGIPKPWLAGSRNCWAKFNKEQINQIRNEYVPYSRANGTRALAIKYKVNRWTIMDIVNNKRYKYD